MKKGQEAKAKIRDLLIYHQNFPEKQVRSHSHQEAHLFIPLKGDIWITYDEKRQRVETGKMLFLAPNTGHSFESTDKQGERIIAQFRGKGNSILLPVNSLIKELLYQILIDSNSPSAQKSYPLFKILLSELLESPQWNQSQLESKAKDERIKKALFILQRDFDINMNSLSKSVGTSQKTLNRLFQNELGISPKQTQMRMRIEKAQTLLKRGGLNVTEVALKVGFNSLSTFIKNYRSFTGVLPSQEK